MDSQKDSAKPSRDSFNSKIMAQNLHKGVFIWVEFKDLFWPAVIRGFRKATVVISYLDSPGANFKIPLRKIRNFNDKVVSETIHGIAETDDRYQSVLDRMKIFLLRRENGFVDCPITFFNMAVDAIISCDCKVILRRCRSTGGRKRAFPKVKFAPRSIKKHRKK